MPQLDSTLAINILESQLATSLEGRDERRTNDEIMLAWSRQTGD